MRATKGMPRAHVPPPKGTTVGAEREGVKLATTVLPSAPNTLPLVFGASGGVPPWVLANAREGLRANGKLRCSRSEKRGIDIEMIFGQC